MRNAIRSIIFLVCLCLASQAFAEGLSADSGWSVPKPLVFAPTFDSNATFRVDSIEYFQKNAFDDAVVLSSADQFVYKVLNKLHFTTREGVVSKLILVHVGDSVTLRQLIESERQLRTQKIFADASIQTRLSPNGAHILRVITSDNWTTTIPFSLTRPDGNRWFYQIGILESNVLGFGQSVGVFYAHQQLRDLMLLRYGNPHFLFPNNKLTAEYAKTSDGYFADFFLGKPFLSKSHNEWAYTIEGLSQRLDQTYYWSAKTLPQPQFVDSATLSSKLSSKNLNIDSVSFPSYDPGKLPNSILTFHGLREDSLSVRFGRSFGDQIKTMARVTYDYHRLGWPTAPRTMSRLVFVDGNQFMMIDSTVAANDFIPTRADSRVGVLVTVSHLTYERLRNFHRIKWTEDVDKGWAITGQATRNITEFGAKDDRWFCDGSVSMVVGSGMNHLSVKSYLESYLSDTGRTVQDFFGRINVEYMFKPSDQFSTVATGLVDGWHNTPLGHQL